MEKLSNAGRIFFGAAIAGIGLQMAYDRDFPYMLLPPNYTSIPGFTTLAFICGILFILVGGCIVFKIKGRPVALVSGGVLLLIFCFYYLPYKFMASANYMHFGEWENAAKELALAAGAFVIAGCFSVKNENPLTRFLGKLIPFGTTLFAITIISFSMDHFLYAKDAADYVPAWIPGHIFWIYFAGIALFASGIAIVLNIKRALAAALLGTMVLIWFIILHIPKVIGAPAADRAGEITSAFLALAYSGIAFVIAGICRRDEGAAGL